MRKDHRPYFLKHLDQKFQKCYTNHLIRPQLDALGKGPLFMKPWHVEIFGANIRLGDHVTVIATPDKKVRLSVWSTLETGGRIDIGNYCLICPGVRLGASERISVGDNCMFASNVYVTDSDWHGVYNRAAMGVSKPVEIGENAWIGDSAIICKGVKIGKNSIIGAGAVVTKDVPPDAIAAGNPARVVKYLDPEAEMITRSQWLADPARLAREFREIDRELMRGNSFLGWVRHLFFPKNTD